jgi:hypothetical protein
VKPIEISNIKSNRELYEGAFQINDLGLWHTFPMIGGDEFAEKIDDSIAFERQFYLILT